MRYIYQVIFWSIWWNLVFWFGWAVGNNHFNDVEKNLKTKYLNNAYYEGCIEGALMLNSGLNSSDRFEVCKGTLRHYLERVENPPN